MVSVTVDVSRTVMESEDVAFDEVLLTVIVSSDVRDRDLENDMVRSLVTLPVSDSVPLAVTVNVSGSDMVTDAVFVKTVVIVSLHEVESENEAVSVSVTDSVDVRSLLGDLLIVSVKGMDTVAVKVPVPVAESDLVRAAVIVIESESVRVACRVRDRESVSVAVSSPVNCCVPLRVCLETDNVAERVSVSVRTELTVLEREKLSTAVKVSCDIESVRVG
jgi:hypothetical protein